jgi:hypothetical protein
MSAKLYRLTDQQVDALLSAAAALLAGPEGDGDAVGVSFKVLDRAADALCSPVSAAAMLGRSTSERKAASSRENGKLGGRPRKQQTTE